MTILAFSWDPRKDRENHKKHGVSFSEAKTVFYDENALLLRDPDHSISEDRFILMGISSSLRFLVIVHCYKGSEGVIRIISARKATGNEQKEIGRHYEKRI